LFLLHHNKAKKDFKPVTGILVDDDRRPKRRKR
jgi:hypothetical protein